MNVFASLNVFEKKLFPTKFLLWYAMETVLTRISEWTERSWRSVSVAVNGKNGIDTDLFACFNALRNNHAEQTETRNVFRP